jgi:hypothetical protein
MKNNNRDEHLLTILFFYKITFKVYCYLKIGLWLTFFVMYILPMQINGVVDLKLI